MADATPAVRDVFLPVHAQESADDFVDIAVRAEALGYERVWLPETWGRDGVSLLSIIADRTETIGVGSGILNVYSRSPALLGQTAATLQERSDGRFRLGLGPSGPALVEGWHGVDYEHPLRRTREAVEIVRAVTRGETVEYDGDVFQVGGFRLRCDPPETPPPVDATGMGPKAVELCGRFADGWHALMLTPDGLADRISALERGTDLGGRSVDDVRVTLSLPCCVAADRERARTLVAGHVAFYVAAMGDFYRRALASQGYEATAEAVTAAWQEGDVAAARAAIDDDLLDDLGVAATPETARDRLRRFAAVEGLDAVAVSFPRGANAEDVETTLRELAPVGG